jgi:hypothetical protein
MVTTRKGCVLLQRGANTVCMGLRKNGKEEALEVSVSYFIPSHVHQRYFDAILGMFVMLLCEFDVEMVRDVIASRVRLHCFHLIMGH